jgi:hypothetical protein
LRSKLDVIETKDQERKRTAEFTLRASQATPGNKEPTEEENG